MAAFISPERLLSPSPAIPTISPQHSGKSNSSAESKGTYAPAVSPKTAPFRRKSPSDAPSTTSCLSLSLALPSNASDCGSDYSVDSNYLTPPLSQGDNEKPPYKPRYAQSPSLDMSAGMDDGRTHGSHKNRAKTRYSRRKRKPLPEINQEYGYTHPKYKSAPHCCLPESKSANDITLQSNHGCKYGRDIIEGNRRLKSEAKSHRKNCKKCSHFMSISAANITTRRWSSVGIGVAELPKTLTHPKPMGSELNGGERKRSSSWTDSNIDEDLMRAVRARLTVHEVSGNYLSTPATITLRRASGITTGISQGLPGIAEAGINTSSLPAPEQRSEPRRSISTYLITTDDIDFITSLIQSGFDVRRTAVGIPNSNGNIPRKPSVTSRGVLPYPGDPAELATTIADVSQVPKAPRVRSENTQYMDSNKKNESARKLSKAILRKSVPEVIWEDTRSLGSPTSSSQTGSTPEGTPGMMKDSNYSWLPGNSYSTKLEGSSSRAISPEDQRRKNSDDDGGDSPTSRIFRWAFKEPKEEKGGALGQFPDSPLPDVDPEPPTASKKEGPRLSIKSARPSVVSFPPLPSRKFTSDWISPLPDMSAPASGNAKCLYGAGIDSRAGDASEDPDASSLEVSSQGSSKGQTEQQHQQPPTPDSDSHRRRKSTNLLYPQVCPRLGDIYKIGNAIGSSSGARRKSSIRSMYIKIDNEDQTSWIKPRKDSGWPAPKTPSPEELDSRKNSHVSLLSSKSVKSQLDKGKRSNEGRWHLISGQTPLLSEADHSGTYGATADTQKGEGAHGSNCQGNVFGKTLLES